MALTKESCLMYWSSRFGINPRIGGRPNFTRNSAGLFTSQEGEVNTAIVNTNRMDWATVSGERRKVLSLELARTNHFFPSHDCNHANWQKLNMTVGTGIADPAGGTTACTLTATAANAEAYGTAGTGASIVRTSSLYIRRRTGSGTISLLRADGGALVVVVPTSEWTRFSAVAPAGVNRWTGVKVSTSGDAVDVWLGQVEDGPFVTAGIQTTSAAATRAADSCYWNFPPVPQGMMIYMRFVEQGTLLAATYLLTTTDAAGAVPQILFASVSGFYVFYHFNGVSNVQATLAAAPAIGDTVEIVGVLEPTGAVSLYQSINGAAVSSGGPSGTLTLPAAWAAPRLYLNSQGNASPGATKFAEVKVVKYADVVGTTAADRMSELRTFELGPSSEVL